MRAFNHFTSSQLIKIWTSLCLFGALLIPMGLHASSSCLGLFTEIRSKGFVDIFRDHGFSSLNHTTSMQNAVSIVSSGGLVSPGHKARQMGNTSAEVWRDGNPDGVYFDIIKENSLAPISKPNDGVRFSVRGVAHLPSTQMKDLYPGGTYIHLGGMSNVVLQFSLNTLESNSHYHIAKKGWQYGFKKKGDFEYDPLRSNPEQLDNFLNENKHPGEVVVFDPVPKAQLESMWVIEIYRNQFIKMLRDSGIFKINGKDIEEVVRTVPVLVRYTVTDSGDVILY